MRTSGRKLFILFVKILRNGKRLSDIRDTSNIQVKNVSMTNIPPNANRRLNFHSHSCITGVINLLINCFE